MPHQMNMNRPPPPLMQVGDMNQQRKSWMHNQVGNDHSQFEDGSNQIMNEPPPSLLGIAPPNFMPQNHQNNFPNPGSFRGNRGQPYNNFRGGRGGIRPRGRGGFRGNFKGPGQW